jgi:hypothetical protein
MREHAVAGLGFVGERRQLGGLDLNGLPPEQPRHRVPVACVISALVEKSVIAAPRLPQQLPAVGQPEASGAADRLHDARASDRAARRSAACPAASGVALVIAATRHRHAAGAARAQATTPR